MELLERLEVDGFVDPQLEFCVFLPDADHVGKSSKNAPLATGSVC